MFAYCKPWMRLILSDFNLVVYFTIAKFLNLVHHQIFQYTIFTTNLQAKKKCLFENANMTTYKWILMLNTNELSDKYNSTSFRD